MEIAKKSTLLFFFVLAANLIAYVYHFLLARLLTTEEYGIFGVSLSILSIGVFASVALSTVVAKLTPRTKEKDYIFFSYLKTALILGIGATLFFFFLAFPLASILRIPQRVVILTVGVIILTSLILAVARGFVQGQFKFFLLGINQLVEPAIRMASGVLLIVVGIKVIGAVLSFGIGFLASFLILLKELPSLRNFHFRQIVPGPQREFVNTLAIVTLFAIFWNLPMIVARRYLAATAVGFFAAAFTLGKVGIILSNVINTVLVPNVAASAGEERERLYRELVITAFCFSLALLIAFFALAYPVVVLLYGREYRQSVAILRFFSLTLVPVSVASVLIYFNIAKSSWKVFWPLLTGIIAEIVLISFFHKSWDQLVFCLLISSILLCVLLLIYDKREKKEKKTKEEKKIKRRLRNLGYF